MDMCKINDFVNKLHWDFPRGWKGCSLKLAIIQFPGIWCMRGQYYSLSSTIGSSPAVWDLVSTTHLETLQNCLLMCRRSLYCYYKSSILKLYREDSLSPVIAAGSHYIKKNRTTEVLDLLLCTKARGSV